MTSIFLKNTKNFSLATGNNSKNFIYGLSLFFSDNLCTKYLLLNKIALPKSNVGWIFKLLIEVCFCYFDYTNNIDTNKNEI